MPNWCHNVLTVRGRAPEIAAFAEAARPNRAGSAPLYARENDPSKPPFDRWLADYQATHPLSLASFVPLTAEADALHGFALESWVTDNWGTKWDAFFDVEAILARPSADPEISLATNGVVVTDEALIYKFQTAWSPPEPAVAAMAAQHPGLEFTLRYAEYGDDYAGEKLYRDGELIDEVELDPMEAFAPEERWF